MCDEVLGTHKTCEFCVVYKNMRKVHRNLSFQLVFVIILVFSIVSLIAGYFDIKFQKRMVES